MVTSRILFKAKQKDEALGALEERTKCVSHPRALGRRNKTGVQRIVALEWRDRSGAALQSCGGIEA